MRHSVFSVLKKPTFATMKTRLLYLLPLLLTVTLIIFGDALGDLWKEDVKALFQQNKWLLLAFVLLLALVGFLWERQQRSEKPAVEEVDKDQYDEAFVQFRKNLLEQYQTRLASKTGRRLPINLTAKSTHFGMAPERVEAYFKDKELTIESDDIASEIDKILKKFDRLLLIGDPGAGKTTILLYAAINILNEASEPKIPLILNLATWDDERDFAEWYAQNIVHSYSLNPVFVQELLRRNAVVPFFDGFDEVAEEYRDDCFQKMAAYFGDQSSRQLIVSSRKKEYAAALADAPVYAEIEVQPLSLSQIKKALSDNAESQAADRALLHALEHDRWLAEAVETPFYLNTASFLFGKGQRTLTNFQFKADSTEGRQAELVEIFVAEQVPVERDRRYLHFLVGKMEEENFLTRWLNKRIFSVFKFTDMHPKFWCSNLKLYRIIVGLTVVWGFALCWGLLAELFFGAILGWIVGLLIGALFTIAISSGRYDFIEIEEQDIEVWLWRTFITKWEKTRFLTTLILLLFLLTLGLIIGLTFDWFWSIIFWIIILGSTIINDGNTLVLLIPNSAYQRFWLEFQNILKGNLAVILLLLIATFTANAGNQKFAWEELINWTQKPVLCLKFTTIAIVSLVLSPLLKSGFLQHFSLRLVLHLEGKMPLRVVTFMDRMTEQLIFEDNRRTNKKGKKMRGATWRFRHKILQDYFAKLQ